MRVETNAAKAVEPRSPPLDAATSIVAEFRRSGHLDAERVRGASQGDLARVMASMSPAERGALEGALGRAGLGDLVGGVLGGAARVVDVASDPLVETPSEQTAEVMQGDVQARWLSDLRGQAELDAALSPFAKLDRPAAAMAAAVSIRASADRD